MLSELMTKKLTKHFAFQDLDQDGFVEKEDWQQCAQNLAKLRDWAEDSPEYAALLQKHVDIWQNFWHPADTDGDGKVNLTEYLALAARQREQGGRTLQLVSDLFTAVFNTIDRDDDGQITVQDYEDYFSAWGIDTALARPAFASLDFSGDGKIAKSIFVQFGSNFFLSDEAEMPGNLLFGPLD